MKCQSRIFVATDADIAVTQQYFSMLLYGRPVLGQALYFHPMVSFFLSIFFFSSPNLSGRWVDGYHTSSTCPRHMVNFGPLTSEISSGVWAPLQISTGFASWQHYCTALP